MNSISDSLQPNATVIGPSTGTSVQVYSQPERLRSIKDDGVDRVTPREAVERSLMIINRMFHTGRELSRALSVEPQKTDEQVLKEFCALWCRTYRDITVGNFKEALKSLIQLVHYEHALRFEEGAPAQTIRLKPEVGASYDVWGPIKDANEIAATRRGKALDNRKIPTKPLLRIYPMTNIVMYALTRTKRDGTHKTKNQIYGPWFKRVMHQLSLGSPSIPLELYASFIRTAVTIRDHIAQPSSIASALERCYADFNSATGAKKIIDEKPDGGSTTSDNQIMGPNNTIRNVVRILADYRALEQPNGRETQEAFDKLGQLAKGPEMPQSLRRDWETTRQRIKEDPAEAVAQQKAFLNHAPSALMLRIVVAEDGSRNGKQTPMKKSRLKNRDRKLGTGN